jgi:hypothetical protein
VRLLKRLREARRSGKGGDHGNGREVLLRRMPKQSVCAEIGVWKGDFSERIIRVVNPRKLYLIDPWIFQPEYPMRWKAYPSGSGGPCHRPFHRGIYAAARPVRARRGAESIASAGDLMQRDKPLRWYGGSAAGSQDDMEEIYKGVIRRFRDLNVVEIYRRLSNELIFILGSQKLDWIYIDGNHSSDSVKVDLELAILVTKKDGYITGDDYDWKDADGCLSVKIAVDSFCAETRLSAEIIGDQFLIRNSSHIGIRV